MKNEVWKVKCLIKVSNKSNGVYILISFDGGVFVLVTEKWRAEAPKPFRPWTLQQAGEDYRFL